MSARACSFCVRCRYDPERKARAMLWQTLQMMGWSHNKDEVVAEGVTATATLQHKFVAYEVRRLILF